MHKGARRALPWLLLALGTGAAGVVCSRQKPAKPPPPPPLPIDSAPEPAEASAEASVSGGELELLEWTMPAPIQRAVVLMPAHRAEGQRFPVVVALHGHGEAIKGPEAGVMGWPRDYALIHAMERIAAPPLTADDFEGLVEEEHLAEQNRALGQQPFRPLIVVCPYSPDVNLLDPAEVTRYGRALVEDVVPRVAKELPALPAPASTGIDGVSLGGALALRIGLGSPNVFGVVGALQPALYEWQASEMTELARSARQKNPALKLRLTTSERDGFRRAVTRTSEAWTAAGITHDFAIRPGPHDYIFNRGPGAMELLFWHDRNLAH